MQERSTNKHSASKGIAARAREPSLSGEPITPRRGAPPERVNASPSRDEPVTVYLAEEHHILRGAWQGLLESVPQVQLAGVTGEPSAEGLTFVARELKPAVVALGVKAVSAATVEMLVAVQEANPQTGILLLAPGYDFDAVQALRRFLAEAPAGRAVVLSHTVDTPEHMEQLVSLVAAGRITMDPSVLHQLIDAEKADEFLKSLTPAEMEALAWMARGYEDSTIAQGLGMGPEAADHLVASIYGKLGPLAPSVDPRVHAVNQYLRGTGRLLPG